MGTLRTCQVETLIGRYGLQRFVETGTGTGTGLEYAQTFPFQQLHSVEIVPQQAARLASRFAGDARVRISTGASPAFLRHLLPSLPTDPILFWLDAHFPGADLGQAAFDAEPDLNRRLLLPQELAAISELRPEGRDVILIDDLRIFERGPTPSVDLEAQGLVHLTAYGSVEAAFQRFTASHDAYRRWDDEGYLLLSPAEGRRDV